MSFTFLRMIRGWFTGPPYCGGRDGARTLGSSMTARTYRLESASASVSSVGLDGAGPTGDSTGITDTLFLITTGINPEAARFTTGAITFEEEARAAALQPVPTQVTNLRAATSPDAAAFLAAREQHRPGLSTATLQLLADTLNPAVRAEPGRGPSAGTARADSREVTRRAEVPA